MASKLADVDLERLSEEQLSRLVDGAQAALRKRVLTHLKDYRQWALRAGITVDYRDVEAEEAEALLRVRAETGSKRKKAEPKYRDPNNPSVTWTGQGHDPRWLTNLEKKGHDRKEFLINKSAVHETAEGEETSEEEVLHEGVGSP
jgi:DNA-binding protein H-NS